MTKRSHLTPPLGIPTPGTPGSTPVHAMRRGGARREVSDRVILRKGPFAAEGWTLNLSRGGVRLISEEAIELGSTYDITFGEDLASRAAKVVWVQEEPDGVVCGLAFVVDPSEPPKTIPPPPPGSRSL